MSFVARVFSSVVVNVGIFFAIIIIVVVVVVVAFVVVVVFIVAGIIIVAVVLVLVLVLVLVTVIVVAIAVIMVFVFIIDEGTYNKIKLEMTFSRCCWHEFEARHSLSVSGNCKPTQPFQLGNIVLLLANDLA